MNEEERYENGNRSDCLEIFKVYCESMTVCILVQYDKLFNLNFVIST